MCPHVEKQVSGVEDCHAAMKELEALSHTTRVAAAVAKSRAAGAGHEGDIPAPCSADLYPSQAPVFNSDLAGILLSGCNMAFQHAQ